MRIGPALAVIVVAGYVGFELHALDRLGYRMEAAHIVEQNAAAGRAFNLCGDAASESAPDFWRNLEAVSGRARRELADDHPQATPARIQEMIHERMRSGEALADGVVAEKGCKDIEVWKLLRRFDNFARLNVS